MMSITNSAFHTWLQHYQESFPTDYSELYASNTNDVNVRGMARGETEDPNEVIDKLLEFPFFGTFISSLEDGQAEPSVHVLHHFFKNSPPGVAFKAGREEVFAWKGTGPDAIVVEFQASSFETSEELRVPTPTLRDFIQASGDPAKVDRLEGAEQSLFTEDAVENQELPNGDPLPWKHLRRCGGIIPPFLVPCFVSASPKDALHSCLATIRYRVEDDFGGVEEADGLNFWKACYPLMQRLWAISTVTHLPPLKA